MVIVNHSVITNMIIKYIDFYEKDITFNTIITIY